MAWTRTGLFVAALALATPLCAQKDKEPPIDPNLPDQCKQLKSMVKDRKMEEDFRAISLIQVMTKDADKKHPKDQKRLAKALGDVFTNGPVREGNRDVLYREAADGLSKLGEDGADELADAAEHKRFDENLSLRAHLLRKLGESKVTDHIDYLVEVTVRSPHKELRAASGEALGHFTNAKIKEKREIVEKIIRTWGSLHSEATRPVNLDPNSPDFGPQNAREILRSCEGHWIGSLQKLTGVSHSKFEDWQRWLNKNKRWEPPS